MQADLHAPDHEGVTVRDGRDAFLERSRWSRTSSISANVSGDPSVPFEARAVQLSEVFQTVVAHLRRGAGDFRRRSIDAEVLSGSSRTNVWTVGQFEGLPLEFGRVHGPFSHVLASYGEAQPHLRK